jgi:mono/diheme cytochrome c family protein
VSTERSIGRGTVIWICVLTAAVAATAGGIFQDSLRARELSPGTPASPGAVGETPGQEMVKAASPEAAGKYLVRLGGCNDCHTPGFMMIGEKVPESDWLTGSPVGFRGPWGTTYPSNLRLFVQGVKEDDFVAQVRARNTRPPMPWPSLHAMSDADLRAIYRYVKSLGAAGKPAPEYAPPGQEPATPYVVFEPIFPKGAQPPAAAAAKAPAK